MEIQEAAILFPLLIPLITAILCLFFVKKYNLQNALSILGSFILLIAAFYLLSLVKEAGIITAQIGGWKTPYGITLVVDMFAAIMICISAFVGFTINIYSLQAISKKKKQFGYYVFFQFLLMGMNGALLAGDIFNLYVWFEVLLIGSFVLLALGNGKEQLIATVKYSLLSFIASAFLLMGVGMIYGITGSLNMADIAQQFRSNSDDPLITVASMLFLMPFAIKSALFPVYFWLPASYHTPPIAITALFSGLLTKIGVYAIIRIFTLLFVHDVAFTHTILLYAAGFTMLSGVLGAAAMSTMRKILSFHIISQIGYMILGLALYTTLGIVGAIFYIIHNILAKTNLFLITGVVEKIKGSSKLEEVSGLYKDFPKFSLIFLIVAISLAGLPPLSGFWAKFILIRAGFEVESYFVIVIALVTGLLTLFSMTKIWINVFWGENKNQGKDLIESETILFTKHWSLMLPIFLMAAATLFIGLYSSTLMEYSTIAAEQLMNPEIYIKKVLGNE